MNQEEKTYHLIDQYLSGELKGTALDRFKAELRKDPELQFQVATQDQIIKSIQKARHEELKTYIQTNAAGKTIQMNKKAVVWTLSSAAAVALLIGAFFGIQQLTDKPGKDGVANNKPQDNTEAIVSNELDSNSGLTGIDTQTLATNVPPADFDPTLPPPPPAILEVLDDAEVASDKTTEDVETKVERYEEEVAEEEIEESEYNYTPRRETTKSKVPAAAEEVVSANKNKETIAKEEMISNTYVVVQNINANFDSYTSKNLDEVATTTTGSTRDKAYQKKEADAEVEVVNNEGPESTDAGRTANTSRNVELQYWKSPVNYTGYTYNGSQVKLYGVPARKKLEFKELDTRLYMKIGRKQYYLENNTKYNRLVEVTNPALLKVLNE